MRRDPLSWLLLAGLAVVWGTAFFFTQVAVEEIAPAPLVAVRVAIAGGALNMLRLALGLRLPRDPRLWLRLFPLAMSGTVVPFFLISWGQQQVPSGVAGMLMAVTPLVTLVMAHFAVRGETLDERKLLGVGLGFAGVAVLLGPEKMGPDQLLALGNDGAVLRQLAVLGGAVGYATNTVLAKRLPPLHPLVYGSMLMLWGTLVAVPLGLAGGPLTPHAVTVPALLSVAWLGVLPTGLASLAHYALVVHAGAGFASLTSYAIPVVAVAAGALLLGEGVEPPALAALALVLVGVALSSTTGRKPERPPRRALASTGARSTA